MPDWPLGIIQIQEGQAQPAVGTAPYREKSSVLGLFLSRSFLFPSAPKSTSSMSRRRRASGQKLSVLGPPGFEPRTNHLWEQQAIDRERVIDDTLRSHQNETVTEAEDYG